MKFEDDLVDEEKTLIRNTALAIIKNGSGFLDWLVNRRKGENAYAFLFDGRGSRYYKWCLQNPKSLHDCVPSLDSHVKRYTDSSVIEDKSISHPNSKSISNSKDVGRSRRSRSNSNGNYYSSSSDSHLSRSCSRSRSRKPSNRIEDDSRRRKSSHSPSFSSSSSSRYDTRRRRRSRSRSRSREGERLRERDFRNGNLRDNSRREFERKDFRAPRRDRDSRPHPEKKGKMYGWSSSSSRSRSRTPPRIDRTAIAVESIATITGKCDAEARIAELKKKYLQRP